MAFRGEKAATKDVDLIVETTEDAEELGRAFHKLGFDINIQPPTECKSLVDARILTESRGMRVDIFVKIVCGKLVLSEGMRSRSDFHASMGNIALFICSREDIFLLKSVTERSRDLDDMVVLYRKGVNKQTLMNECEAQGKHDDIANGRIWEVFLSEKIEEMEEAYGISVPWKRELRKTADMKLGRMFVLGGLNEEMSTVPRLALQLGLSRSDVRAIIMSLEEDELIAVDRSSRPHKLSLKKPKII